jgi:hypothetical protein
VAFFQTYSSFLQINKVIANSIIHDVGCFHCDCCICSQHDRICRENIFKHFLSFLTKSKFSQRSTARNYQIQNFQNCPTAPGKSPAPLTVYATFPATSYNKFSYNDAFGILTEEITSTEVDLVIEGNRCSLDIKTCEKYPTIKVENLCMHVERKNAYYSAILEKFEPRLHCPVKPANYTIMKYFFDLKSIALLPLDGYVFVLKVTLASKDPKTKKKKLVGCANIEIKITRERVRL